MKDSLPGYGGREDTYIPYLVPWWPYYPVVYRYLHTLGTPVLLPVMLATLRTMSGKTGTGANPPCYRTDC